ncbi:MAG TPA: hypothetical protein VIZ90_09090 [Rhizobiaceae bacterium]
MPEGAARANLRDLLDGGHWVLETNLDEVAGLARDLPGRVWRIAALW